ncbi:PhzF family phenazine biosynthesis protein [Erythrobacter aureus]|uniref:PhzF family phenazine biosynthesis protein n=1 Tax=Erythrobacter aureus TaxID=2182384 RepID=A0A345YBJ9_9SPHN|nr:PhzF family phenazine biosynthesis protein [Erythrobacter aureus]AXK41301.1 PhzF family phenazine biosynthesis protein [Erythrobacter aureus]
MVELHRLAAFSDGASGGNPAGVYLSDEAIDETAMQEIAADVGYSETAFAFPAGEAWRVRYFAPEGEVPFCGHATIALGAVLARKHGDSRYDLVLNDNTIHVTASANGDSLRAQLVSPSTRHRFDEEIAQQGLELFELDRSDLTGTFPPVVAHAGANHLIIPLKDRTRLSSMSYDLAAGRDMMRKHQLTTIALVFEGDDSTFHVRNAFASGGVLEDPATGAAAAAFAGFLRDHLDSGRQHITIIQGEDMGMRSVLNVAIPQTTGEGVQVSGDVRVIEAGPAQ